MALACLLVFASAASASLPTPICIPTKASAAVKSATASGECTSEHVRAWAVGEEEKEALEHVAFVKEGLGGKPEIRVAGGVNVRIFGIKGSGTGNLLIGTEPTSSLTGSNNLVMGKANSVAGESNLVGGTNDTTSPNTLYSMVFSEGATTFGEAKYDAILAGQFGSTEGSRAAVIAGENDTAAEQATAVIGGERNKATAHHAVVVGGKENVAEVGEGAAVFGGELNVTKGAFGVDVGGQDNLVSGPWSGVLGGFLDKTEPTATWGAVMGGRQNTAKGVGSTVNGGKERTATGEYEHL